MRALGIWFLLGWLLSVPARAEELRVAAAASLAESVTEWSRAYEKAHGVKVRPVFAGSHILARQIEAGASVDVFLSADERTMEELVSKGLVARSAVHLLLENSLVVVVANDAGGKLEKAEDLLALRRIAVGDPAAVPAGVYAKRWLTGRGLWETLAPRCVGAESVRSALAMVEAGNAEAAIVYRTDAAVSRKVKIAFAVPDKEAPAVRYPVAVCKNSRRPQAAARFVESLQSPQAAEVFRRYGFDRIGPVPAP